MRDARSPWSWSGNSYRGHMAWKTAAAGKTASNSPSVRMNFHVLLVLMSPRTMLRRFVLCFFCLCTREDLLFFCGKKKFSGQTCYLCFHELESVWIWVLIRQTVKRVVKLHVFVLTELFFCFCSLENSLWPQLLRWTLYLHLCLTSALQQIFIHLALLQPPQCFLHSSSHPLLLVSYWPFVTTSLLLLLFSHLPLFLITLSLSLFSLPHPPGLRSWSHAHDSSSHMETFSLWMWGSFYCC